MHKPEAKFGIRRTFILSLAGFAVVASAWVSQQLRAARTGNSLQIQPTSAQLPDFDYDVVSIKPTPLPDAANPRVVPIGIVYSADGMDAQGMRLWGLLINAYGVQRLRVVGAPDWADNDRFNIFAKIDGPTQEAMQKLPPEQLKLVRQRMLQKILADRFKLTFHHETKEMSVYFLTIAKGGSKLQDPQPDKSGPNDLLDFEGNKAANRFAIAGNGNELAGQAVTMPNMVAQLSAYLSSPIVDKTGLTGTYDFRIKFSPDYSAYNVPPAPGGSAQPMLDTQDPIIAAIVESFQKYLGLKLEKGKGPVEIMVIDHVEKPSDN